VPSIILLDRALDDLAEVVAIVPRDQLGDPTPCQGWDVAHLLRHLVELNWRYGILAEGGDFDADDIDDIDVDLLGVDHIAAFEASRKTALSGWHDPDALVREFPVPDGTIDGAAALDRHMSEVAIHGWDLARAVGAHYVIDPEVAAHLLANVGTNHVLDCQGSTRRIDLVVSSDAASDLLASLGRVV
jgi:uncharacterized protein (TIGR03086 family)